MKENKYDNKEFFSKYSQMDRSVKGLSAAGEWETLKSIMPNLKNKSMLDLGCGFGWHCQYAIDEGAKKVVGIDISTNMLEVAKEKTDSRIEYEVKAMEDINYPNETFDVVLSSLALHYIKDFNIVVDKVYSSLKKEGVFLFSVEHPVFTAEGSQNWKYKENGDINYFPVNNYFYEGKRNTSFLGEKVVKYHRTLTTYIQLLLDIGFSIHKVIEPMPSKHLLDVPGMKDEMHRPMMLIIYAVK
ncbi:MAG: class I SAM-dependent methyltransferase [Coprobacillaceae bacterium]